jgi:Ca2+-binding RTX toxin-like protein
VSGRGVGFDPADSVPDVAPSFHTVRIRAMNRNTGSASLKLETLEVRDVPAIILNSVFNPQRNDAAPLGGVVNITELQLALSDTIFNRRGTAAPRVVKPAASNDIISFSFSPTGNTLTITDQDGIFGRVVNGNNIIVTYGTTLQIANVTGFNIGLQLGGNDSITDNTPLPTTLNAGPGNDVVTGKGIDGTFSSFLLFQTTGNLDALLTSALAAPTKALMGGDGNDSLSVTGSVSGWAFDGGSGNDTITGPQFGFLNAFSGGDGTDNIVGPLLGTSNFFDGGFDTDVIVGGLGSDLMVGGPGFDVLIGFGGRDTFITRDVDFDSIVNLPGDTIFDDPFDLRSFRPIVLT